MRIYQDTRNYNLKVGDKFYYVNVEDEEVQERYIVNQLSNGYYLVDNYGKKIHIASKTYNFFLEKEQAEQSLRILLAEKKKRKLLIKYEVELNKKFNLDTFMVK